MTEFLRFAADLGRRHAAYLAALGPVRTLALDPCPKCGGKVMASTERAVCAGCGWAYQPRITIGGSQAW